MRLDPFYLIVESADWLERLVPLGVRLAQLRIKGAPETAIRAQIRRGKSICDEHDCRLVINDYWRLAIEESCEAVHLGQDDLQQADRSAIAEAGIHLGVSTHDHRELERALAVEPDYVALGPIYETKLKRMPWAPQGLARLREWSELVSVPLVAIGGLRPDRLEGVFAAGASSAAVVTDIAHAASPEERVIEWIEATARFR